MASANTASARPSGSSNAARDYYEVLGVARTADGETIRQAYRRLARELHPDVSAEPKAEERFRELTGAYTVLSDPNARLLYDRFGYRGRGSGFSLPGAASASPVLAEVNVDAFEAAQEQAERCATRAGSNARHATAGASRPAGQGCETCSGKGRLTRSANLRRRLDPGREVLGLQRQGVSEKNACPECRGEGSLSEEQVMKVRIPAGVEDGNRLRMLGDPDGEQLLVQVRPLPEDSYLVLVLAAVLLLCSVALLVYFLSIR